MTVINLRRYYYPLVKTGTFMEVPEEVAEALLQLHREENNRINKRFYHKAYFSLDCDDGIENDAIGWEQPSPEELVIQAEEEAAKVFQKTEVDEGGTINRLEEEKRKVETELRQLQNRQKILLNKKANVERKGRTHRLIERVAILESVFPTVAAMTGEEVKAFLLSLSRLPGAGEAATKSAKSGKAQLARKIEIALPVELDRAAQLALVRAYVKDNFVSAGMCADFALHDKGGRQPTRPHYAYYATIGAIRRMGREVPQGVRP